MFRTILLSATFCIASAVSGMAASISDGDVGASPTLVTTVPQIVANELDGTIRYDRLIDFSVGSGTSLVTGTIQSRVVERNSDSLLNFAFRVRDLSFASDASGALASLTSLTLSGFEIASTGPLDVFSLGNTVSLGDTAITSVSRTGGSFTFDLSALNTTAGSTFTTIKTDISAFGAGQFGVIVGGGDTLTLDNIATPVPLPAGLPLMLLGLGAFGVMARRHKT